MRRFAPPLAVAILALAAGCADTTSPAATARTALSPSALIGNPPPPPSDTSGSYSYSSSSTFGTLYFGAIYFLNPTEKAGFIHFNTTQPAGVIASPDASIDYHLGTITGTGTITAPLNGGMLNVDLTKVVPSVGFFNPTCSGPVVGDYKYSCASVSAPATFTDGSGTSTVDGVFTIGVRVPTGQ